MSKREVYVRELQKYINVDIYGQCGDLSGCPRSEGNDCPKRLATKYKFYLAFENAICEEYVTEKFTRTMTYPTVPIVMGGADYSSFAPENSHINVFDFQSAEHLAKYLLYLDKHIVSQVLLNKQNACINPFFNIERIHAIFPLEERICCIQKVIHC